MNTHRGPKIVNLYHSLRPTACTRIDWTKAQAGPCKFGYTTVLDQSFVMYDTSTGFHYTNKSYKKHYRLQAERIVNGANKAFVQETDSADILCPMTCQHRNHHLRILLAEALMLSEDT